MAGWLGGWLGAAAGLDATYPRVIHGRTFDTKEQYDAELAEYIMGL